MFPRSRQNNHFAFANADYNYLSHIRLRSFWKVERRLTGSDQSGVSAIMQMEHAGLGDSWS